MKKNKAFTLIELMIAGTIAVISLTVAFSLIGNVYFSHKKIRIAQNFYGESRFVLEKVVNLVRENTIDYDRYFEEVGPDNCSFNSLQGNPNLGYPNVFYWKLDENSEISRNLGGYDLNGNIDKCSQAFHGDLTELYLINKERNIRYALKNTDENRLQLQIELGSDTDNDGKADEWSSNVEYKSNKSECVFKSDNNKITLISDEDLCYLAQNFTNISAKNLKIDKFNFTPYPNRDPFLAFRVDEAQVHPNVFLFLKIDLTDYQKYGFDSQPTITMQTSASSRIFKNTRKK